MKAKIQGTKDSPKPKEDVVGQATRHLRQMRDMFAEQIERLAKYPDFASDVVKMRAMLKDVDRTMAETEGK